MIVLLSAAKIMDSLQTKEHVTDYLFSMAANEMRVGMAVMRMR